MYPKFPFPIVTKGFEQEKKQEIQANHNEWWKERLLKQSTKSLIDVLREIRYRGNENYRYLTEGELVQELAKRPHQRNKTERKEFVAKQQKRTERKTKGAR